MCSYLMAKDFFSTVFNPAETVRFLQPDSSKAPQTKFSSEIEGSQETENKESNEGYSRLDP